MKCLSIRLWLDWRTTRVAVQTDEDAARRSWFCWWKKRKENRANILGRFIFQTTTCYRYTEHKVLHLGFSVGIHCRLYSWVLSVVLQQPCLGYHRWFSLPDQLCWDVIEVINSFDSPVRSPAGLVETQECSLDMIRLMKMKIYFPMSAMMAVVSTNNNTPKQSPSRDPTSPLL